MNIGIDTSALTPKPTGTGRYISCLLEQLEQLPYSVRTFSPFTNGVHLSQKGHYGALRRHYFMRFSLKKMMHDAHVDFGIFPNYFMPEGFTRPAAVVIHDLSFLTHPHFYSRAFVRFYTYRLKKTLQHNPVIAAVSDYTASRIQKYLGIPKDDIFLLQGYSRLSDGAQRSFRAEKPYFLYVGHIEPRKNLPFLIDGFLEWKQQRQNDTELKIVGELWINTKRIRSLLKKCTKNTGINVTGHVDDFLLQKLYARARGFVHTSHVEGFGFPILEAMHFGLPIVSSRNSAAVEVLSSGGIYIDPADKRSLIDGLDRLNEKSQNQTRIHYDIKYSPELMKNQLAEMLGALFKRGKRIYSPGLPAAENLQAAIKKTLLYARLFDSGIKRHRLHPLLHDISVAPETFERAVNTLIACNGITSRNDVLYLNDNTTPLMLNRKQIALSSKRAAKLMKWVKRVPFISMIAFSGGTAHYGDGNHNDLDLFVMTKPHTVYIVYAVLHLLSYIFKARRHICPNYIIDETAITIDFQRDLFTAHQIVSLTPCKSRKMLDHFIAKNDWIREYFPNFPIPVSTEMNSSRLFSVMSILNWLIYLLYRFQWRKLLREKGSNGSLRLTRNIIKLHTKDHHEVVLEAFAEALHSYWSKDALQEIGI